MCLSLKIYIPKDSRGFLEKGQKPEHCVDLKGASIEWCQGDKSKRSNVFEVSPADRVLLCQRSFRRLEKYYIEGNN